MSLVEALWIVSTFTCTLSVLGQFYILKGYEKSINLLSKSLNLLIRERNRIDKEESIKSCHPRDLES